MAGYKTFTVLALAEIPTSAARSLQQQELRGSGVIRILGTLINSESESTTLIQTDFTKDVL
jgi:hypothetical protein